MKLKLITGDEVSVNRMNCGHQFTYRTSRRSVNWNIDPISILHENGNGFFVIGPWGSGYKYVDGEHYYDPSKFERMIPVRNVLEITELDVPFDV
jgi:hypothetical protein